MNKNDFINERLGNLLSRLSPPRAIAKDAQLQGQEIALLASAIFRGSPRDGYSDWWDGFEGALLGSLQTRAWPTLNEVNKAISTQRAGRSSVASGFEETKMEWVRQWVRERRKPHPGFNSPDITSRLIDEGMLRNLREARFLGFDMTFEQQDIAKGQPCGRDEWVRHCEILARMRRDDFATVEAHERANIHRKNDIWSAGSGRNL